MKKHILLFLSVIFYVTAAFTQISQGGKPLSFSGILIKQYIAKIDIPAPSMEKLLMEDIEESYFKGRFRSGVVVPANISPENSGTWEILPDGARIWRLRVSSKNAKALCLYFDEYQLPPQATFFTYSSDKKEIYGAYTEFNNDESGMMATQPVSGDEMILELFLPAHEVNNYDLHINEIGYIYRNSSVIRKSKELADTCLVNINCPEGNDWQIEKRGVVKLLMKIGFSTYECSGSLVNNTYGNCIPYVLTASHCGEGATTGNLNQWIFYFGYEASNCADTIGPKNKTSVGCTFAATDNWNGSLNSTSDFYMVRLKNSIPQTYQPYYNGWSRDESASIAGVGIHHPMGDIKKISTYTTTLSNHINFWGVIWAPTITAHSVTEEGSSGSPLFNTEKYIVGTLTGGLSFCNKPNEKDLYGKFFKHWESAGTTSDKQLKPWLDPAGTNPIKLNGVNYTNCTTISIEEKPIPNLNLSVYPNPATQFVSLHFENYYFENGVVYINDMLGHTLQTVQVSNYRNDLTFSTTNLAPGLYVLVARDSKNSFKQYFVKE